MMSWHMSTSNTINDIHADEHGNACRSYLPWKSSHCHTQLAGCKQSQNLNGFSVRGSMPRPARCEQRLTIEASSVSGVLSHSSWAACTSQDVPADAHAQPVVDGLKTPSKPARVQHPRMSPLMQHTHRQAVQSFAKHALTYGQ